MSLIKLNSLTVSTLCSAQVITNASTAVKELMENSLDAGATNIEVKLQNFGLDRIEVKDDGKGVSSEDIAFMCKKSYTSKITGFEDLTKILSFGFRGEALSCLCEVANVSITTITEADKIATTYVFDRDGNIVLTKPSHIIKGTTVVAEDLFKHLPIRKQLLSTGKKKLEELRKVEIVVKSLGMIHPRLRVVFTHNKCVIWQKNSVPNLRLALSQVIAPTIVKQLVDLKFSGKKGDEYHLLVPQKGCNIASLCYGNAGEAVYVFVNRRPVKYKRIEKAVQNEVYTYFGNDIPGGKHPICVVAMTVPPSLVDINLEPNKNKVLLSAEIDRINLIKNQLIEYYIGSVASPLDNGAPQINEPPHRTMNGEQFNDVVKQSNGSLEKKVELVETPIQERKNPFIMDSPQTTFDSDNTNPYEEKFKESPSIFTPKPLLSNVTERNKNIKAFLDGLNFNNNVTNKERSEENIFNPLIRVCESNSRQNQDPGSQGQTIVANIVKDKPSTIDARHISSQLNQEVQIKMDGANSSTTVLGCRKEPVSEGVENETSTTIVNIDALTKTPQKEEPDINNRTSMGFTLSQWSRGQIKVDGAIVKSSTTVAGPKGEPMDEDIEYETSNKIVGVSALRTSQKEELSKNDPSSMDITDITLSQWSRGQVKVDGATVNSSVAVVGSKEALLDKDEGTANESYTSSALTRIPQEEETAPSIYERSISSQMGCKDMAGFTKFASEMTNKIAAEGSGGGLSFQRVARQLATKWRELQDSDKEHYCKKAKLMKQEKDTKEKASMRNQLQKFLAKSNEKKITKTRSFWQSMDADVSMGSVRKALEQRLANKPKETIEELRLVESPQVLKVATVGSNCNTLYFYSRERLQESLLFFKELSSMVIPYRVLDRPIVFNKEQLGESLWPVLMSLEKALDVKSGSMIISDNRITSNGLRIEIFEGYEEDDICQITDLPYNSPTFGLEELKEILSYIKSNPNVPLKECRPLPLITFIRAETVRMINVYPEIYQKYGDKFHYWFNSVKDRFENCPHQNPVYWKSDLSDIIK